MRNHCKNKLLYNQHPWISDSVLWWNSVEIVGGIMNKMSADIYDAILFIINNLIKLKYIYIYNCYLENHVIVKYHGCKALSQLKQDEGWISDIKGLATWVNWLDILLHATLNSDDSFICIFLNEKIWISIKISLKFILRVQLTIF